MMFLIDVEVINCYFYEKCQKIKRSQRDETATNFRQRKKTKMKNIESADELEQQRLFLSNEIEDTGWGCHVSYR
jgi:hypothetical protein